MNQLELPHLPGAPARPPRRPARTRSLAPVEFKIQILRECGTDPVYSEDPAGIVQYWREHIPAAPWFDPCKESFVVILLNTRHRIIGHNLVALGHLDSVLVHPRETFRPAIVAACHSIVIVHNHPSGDPAPSEADLRVTRELFRAGQMLKIELLDHLIIGYPAPPGDKSWVSLRELNYLYP